MKPAWSPGPVEVQGMQEAKRPPPPENPAGKQCPQARSTLGRRERIPEGAEEGFQK